MNDNKVKHILENGKKSYGVGLNIMAPGLVELIGLSGFDFVILDDQHSWMDYFSAADLIRTAENVGLTPMVRVSDVRSPTIGKMLDLGAQGIIFPNVNTADDAKKAVESVKYEPYGTRSSCPTVRSVGYSSDRWEEHYEHANRNIFTLMIIESREGFDNIEDILDVEGIDAVLLGPFDLSSSLGIPGQVGHPEVIERVVKSKKIIADRGLILCDWNLEFDPKSNLDDSHAQMFWFSGTKIFHDALRGYVAQIRGVAD